MKFLLWFLFAVSSFAADRVLHVVLVRTADTDGGKASTATAAGFKIQADRANAIWAGNACYPSQTGWYPGLTASWEDLGKYVE